MKKIALFFAAVCVMALACILGGTAAYADDEVDVDNNLPVVYINIDESRGTIEDMLDSYEHTEYCYGTLSIDVPEGFHYSDFPDVELEDIDGVEMSIRGRGNSTWRQSAKKPFKIKLNTKTNVLGLGANKHWVLIANSFDESLLRDRITAWLGDYMEFDFTPRGVPVDVVITGETYGTKYLGSYYLSENVRVDSNRLDIEELDEDDVDPDVITGGYLLQNSLQVRLGSPDRFTTSRGAEWATNTPSFDTEGDEASLTSVGEDSLNDAELNDAYKNTAQQEYIQKYIQDFEDVLYEEGTAYRDLMDVETAAKYWLINMIPLNQDAYATGSTYLYKDRDSEDGVSKLYWGPVWDFDFGWTNNISVTGFSCGHIWMKPLFYDKSEGGFVQELYKQWPIFREGLEELIADGGVIDQYYEETKESAEADYKVYHTGTDFDYLSYVEKMKTWIRNRIDWVDEHFDELSDMVHKVTYVVNGEKFATDFLENEERLSVDSQYPDVEGYTFTGWADEDGNIIDSEIYLTEDITLTAQFVPDSEVSHITDVALRKSNDITTFSKFFSSYTIRYEVVPADAFDQRVIWTSSDESIATVSDTGFVKYYKTGTVTFTAKTRLGKTRTFTLTIVDEDAPYAKSISPVDEVIELEQGEYSALYINTDPSPAKISSYEYTSDDESVVSVDEYGALTANGVGRTVVHVTAYSYDEEFNDVVLETEVEVIVKEAEPETEPESESGTEPESGSEPETEPGTDPTIAPETTPETAPAATTETKADGKSESPKTGDYGMAWGVILAAVIAIMAAIFSSRRLKKR